VLYHQRISSA